MGSKRKKGKLMTMRELPLEPPPEREPPEESLYDEMCWLFGQMMEEANNK